MYDRESICDTDHRHGRVVPVHGPTSPKGQDLRERGWFALHHAVPDNEGSGGEFWVTGRGLPVDEPDVRSRVACTASYTPADRYVLFELRLSEAQ